ncbi:MAG: PilC/PilY family type IV pilus protein [Proteobacteria bacterium]|nr:PilC/PilY family type IV pilus protein [Pseudomonadota bacterium]
MKKIILLFLFIFICRFGVAGAAMNDYCVTPTFTSTTTKPNILILMDYSGSMQFPANITCDYNTSDPYDGQVVNCQTPSSSTTDNYSTTKTYYGYFDTSKYYQYTSGLFRVNTTCTNTDKIGNSNTCISGNLLNWIASTRIDVSRKVLTGGRTSTGASDIYQSEGARVVYTDTGINCKFTITTTSTSGAGSTKARTLAIANRSGYTCPLGTLSASDIDVEPQNPSADTGIVQDFYDKVTFEFMIFNTAYKGKLLSAKDATQSSLIAATINEQPYDGTPTGEGLWEAYDFFKQSNDHSYSSNTSDINAGNGNKDPYYDGSGASSTAVPCRKSFVLLISDGVWNDSIDPVTPARTMRTTDMRSDLTGTQNVITYVVYAFGDKDPTTKLQGRQAMKTTAMFGGFDDSDSNTWPYPFTAYPSSSKTVTYPITGCNPATGGTWSSSCKEWDKNKTGEPYNFFEADDGDALATALINALNDMLRRASSGTAASVLASSEGSGANLLQSVFYPKRLFTDTEIEWTGEIQNLWYYIDPYLQSTSIREDTNIAGTSGASILNLADDYQIEFYFDTTDNKTKAKRYSTAADGTSKTYVDTVFLEDIKNLWEAGTVLFQRNLTTSPRTIYTTINGSSFLANNFSITNKTTLSTYLQAADATEAEKIINYVHGTDQTGYRSRTVTVSGTTGVWKLGDIVASTPRLQSSIPAASFNKPPPDGYSDSTYLAYTQTSSYLSRGMAYTGANDGMLHAFKLGKLEQTWSGQGTSDKAKLTNLDTATALGSEVWSFIPKNSLPYLKYTADTNYCHLYFVDLPPSIIDTSAPSGTGSEISTATKTTASWKTILVGGMGLGGANKITSYSCTTGASGTCVKTPITDPSDTTKGLGYSSYFALNITDPSSPSLLWEFSDPALGFSTSGPAIIRIGAADKNGKWFAVFASGPTGSIDTTNHQFLGKSDQNLKLFVLDLYTGSLLRTIDTGVSNAFGGSLYGAVIDTDKGDAASSGHYSDDAFYLGYTKKDTATSTWTKGGVLRIITKEDADPANWVASTVIDNIGPITSAVAKLQDRTNKNLWLYFGTGRFFYRYGTTIDDASGQQALYGLKDPCYSNTTAIPPGPINDIDNACTSTLTTTGLDNQSGNTPSSSLSSGATGWYINLDAASGNVGAERVITDPLAAFFGTVFFTTYTPSIDICSLGGNTNIWAVKYDVGGAVGGLQGQALTQVSTGAIHELPLATAFTEKGGRRTAAITGMPPKGQGLAILVGPKPLRKILHIKER